jgi:hypothetical protein
VAFGICAINGYTEISEWLFKVGVSENTLYKCAMCCMSTYTIDMSKIDHLIDLFHDKRNSTSKTSHCDHYEY